MAMYNPPTGYEPKHLDNFDDLETSAMIFKDESGDMDTEPSYSYDAEVDDEIVGKAPSSPLFTQKRQDKLTPLLKKVFSGLVLFRTNEHGERRIAKFWRLAQDLARAAVPEEILDVIRLGWRHCASSRGRFLLLNGQLLHFSTPSQIGLEESPSPTQSRRLLTLTTAPPSCRQSTGSVLSTSYPERPC